MGSEKSINCITSNSLNATNVSFSLNILSTQYLIKWTSCDIVLKCNLNSFHAHKISILHTAISENKLEVCL